MSTLFLLIILALFLLPAFLQMRTQRKRLNEIRQVQESLRPGDRVVTSAGLYATVRDRSENTVDLEIAEGVVSTFELIAVVRTLEAPGAESAPVMEETSEQPLAPQYEEQSAEGVHPENLEQPHPEQQDAPAPEQHPEGWQGSAENRRD
ncbi:MULTISPECIES: preprotein translocase subunit YajC [unclassified Corynebacterium]|uniref:preprotein translocase subunit YajC n=1 Tax=unclassified Corynebacterium TaxID=2624378 RepID=UPI001C44FDD0|nr:MULTISPECIES: preprotein translocase subunit YajC [unclassified Corynebacterium]MBV7281013.1 preprotein translocase subunit YajC [Corynebacterium sp. TAE3-ERU30]MBV7302735.1 preprotein translocase subunit YajC [Corynebacterium sp. TAE3-ERU2]